MPLSTLSYCSCTLLLSTSPFSHLLQVKPLVCGVDSVSLTIKHYLIQTISLLKTFGVLLVTPSWWR